MLRPTVVLNILAIISSSSDPLILEDPDVPSRMEEDLQDVQVPLGPRPVSLAADLPGVTLRPWLACR